MSTTASTPSAFRDRMLQLLGDRDPFDVLTHTAGALASIVRQHPMAVVRTRPFPGKWSPNEVIGHLVDSEWVYGYRLRLILCEDHPTILGMDQDAWVAGQRHNDRDPADLVETFRMMRQFNLTLWKQASPAELQRTGNHNERGPESLEVVLRMLAGHDLNHLGQLTRNIQAVRQRE